jgi:hypothetical protein
MGLMKNEFLTRKRYWMTALIALAIALLVTSGHAYSTLSTPRYKTMKENVDVCTVNGWYEYWVVVEKENPIWPVGTKLEGTSIYFPTVASNLNGKAHLQISSTSLVNVSVNYQLKEILSSSIEKMIYWSKEKTIESGQIELTNANQLEIEFGLDLTEIKKEIKEIRDALGFYSGNVELKLILSVDYQGSVGNEEINGRREIPLVIKLREAYRDEFYCEVSSQPLKETIKKEIIQRLAVPYSDLEKTILIAPPTILFVTFVGLAVIKWRYKPLTEEEIEELRREREIKRFKEEVSFGELPEGLELPKAIRMASLKDLVEVAIDTDKRVIYDKKKKIYFVIDGQNLYFYQFPEKQKVK